MNVHELFESSSLPEWVKSENSQFAQLADKFGLKHTKKPKMADGIWSFGGELKDVASSTLLISLDKRVAGLQKAVAKYLFDLKEEGREVSTFDTSWYGPKFFGHQRTDTRPFLPDDALSYFEQRVKDKLFINTISSGGYSIIFRYSVSEPKPKEEPKPVERKVYRVVNSTK